jgi:hypothetical protein
MPDTTITRSAATASTMRLELVHELQGRWADAKSVCLITKTEELKVRPTSGYDGITLRLPGQRYHTLIISDAMLDEIVRQRDALRHRDGTPSEVPAATHEVRPQGSLL